MEGWREYRDALGQYCDGLGWQIFFCEQCLRCQQLAVLFSLRPLKTTGSLYGSVGILEWGTTGMQIVALTTATATMGGVRSVSIQILCGLSVGRFCEEGNAPSFCGL